METTELAGGQSRGELIAALNAKLLREQNLPLAIVAGAVASLIGALLWMGITVVSQMHIGLVAIAVGAGVGFAVRFAGKGLGKVYGVIGAVFTLLSCVAGELLAVIQEIATERQSGFFEILGQVDFGKLVGLVMENASPITYLIYGIGIYEGYKFSIRKLTPQDLHDAGLSTPPPPPQ